MLLQYQIGVDASQLRRQLRSVEGEFAALQRRLNASASRSRNPLLGGRAAGSVVNTTGESVPQRRVLANITAEERARLRKVQREAREQSRADVAAHRRRLRQLEQEASMARRLAARQAALAARFDHQNRAAMARHLGAGYRGARNLVGVGLGIGGLMGGVAAMSSISSEIDIRRRSSMVANQAGVPGRKGEIQQAVRGVSGATGDQALGALEEWQTVTGDIDLGLAQLQRFSKIALATGTSMDELAAAAGNAFNAIKDEITDPAKRLEALDAILRSAAAQGALGAVEIKQMATEMAALAAVGGQFGTDRPASIMRSIAMAQVARAKGGAPSAAEAVTSVERFNADIVTKEKDLRGMGVNIWADAGKTMKRDQDDIVVDIIKATKGDQSKLGDIFGAYGMRGVRGFASIYSTAERKEKGSGEAAIRAEFERFMGAITDESALNDRFASRLDDPDIQLAKAADRFNAAVGTKLLPVITELIPRFENMIPVMADIAEKGADLASWFIKNPFEGVGAVAAASMGKSILDSGIEQILETQFGGALLRTAGTVGALAAAFVVGKELIDAAIGWLRSKEEAEFAKDMDDTNAYSRSASGVNAGRELSTEERQRLRKMQLLRIKEAQKLRKPRRAPAYTGGMSATPVELGASDEDLRKAKELEKEAARFGELLERDKEQRAAIKAQKEAADESMAAAKKLGDAADKLAKATNTSRSKPVGQRS